MPRHLKRYHDSGELHFITFSCFARRPLLRLASRRQIFLRCLEEARRRFKFVVLGYVVMPEHVHLLVSEPTAGRLSAAIQVLKQNRSRLSRRKRNSLQQELFRPQEVTGAFWQTRYYDFNVHTTKKRIEKLKYMHLLWTSPGLSGSTNGPKR